MANTERHYDYRRGAIEVVNASTGLMACSHCGNSWIANLRSRADQGKHPVYYRGSWTCSNCGTNSKDKWEPPTEPPQLLVVVRCTEDGCAYDRTVSLPERYCAEFADRDPAVKDDLDTIMFRLGEDRATETIEGLDCSNPEHFAAGWTIVRAERAK